MPASSRRKGVDGEREVAAIWRLAGYQVQDLEGVGDHVVHLHNGTRLHEEVKRQERIRLPEWVRQAEAEAPRGAIAVVAWRQNNGVWRADLRLDALVELAP
jgi:hypothetical protein